MHTDKHVSSKCYGVMQGSENNLYKMIISLVARLSSLSHLAGPIHWSLYKPDVSNLQWTGCVHHMISINAAQHICGWQYHNTVPIDWTLDLNLQAKYVSEFTRFHISEQESNTYTIQQYNRSTSTINLNKM